MANPDRDFQGEERREEDRFPVIGIVGPMASGKETVAQILKDNFGIAYFKISDNLKRLAAAQGVKPPYARKLLGDISLKLVDQLGAGANIQLTHKIIQTQRALIKMQGATIVGIKHISEAEKLKEIPGSLLVAITAPQPLRYERALHREDAEDESFYDRFLKRDATEAAEIEPIFALADIIIENNGTPEELEKQVIDLFIEKTRVF
jgi:dephospho-CoA kinase